MLNNLRVIMTKVILFFCISFVSLQAMDKPDIQVVPHLLKTINVGGAIDSQMVYTPNGQLLVANVKTQSQNIMKLIKTAGYTDVTDIEMPSALTYITTVSPDSQFVTTADALSELRQWNLNVEDSVALPHTQEATEAQYDLSGKRLMFSNPYGTYLLDLNSNQIVKSLGKTYQSADFCWHPTHADQAGISTVGDDWKNSQWGIWDLVADKVRTLTTVPIETTGGTYFTNDGESLIATAVSQTVTCDTKTAALTYYSLHGAKSNNPLKGDNKSLYASQFLKGNGIRFYAGTSNNTVVYCDTQDTTKSFMFNPESGDTSNTIYALAMSADGNQLAVPTQSGNKNLVKIFDVNAQTRLAKEREAVKKAQASSHQQFNIEGDVLEQAALEQAFGIPASPSTSNENSKSLCYLV